jgi:hypothetical protein
MTIALTGPVGHCGFLHSDWGNLPDSDGKEIALWAAIKVAALD